LFVDWYYLKLPDGRKGRSKKEKDMNSMLFKADYSRRYPDPITKEANAKISNLQHHLLVCRAKDLPVNIPLDPNPRNQKTDKSVYREVKKSLLSDADPTFLLKNKGITIIADRVKYDGDKHLAKVFFAHDQGIVDGGHTYKIILENQSECPENQYVKIEVLTGVPDYLIELIAQGLNTAVQVQEMSLANLAHKFDWIKKLLKDEPYYDQIAFRENEEGSFDIREIIGIMTMFNIEQFSGQTDNPKIAYTSKAKCLELYKSHEDSYKKMEPLFKEILHLYDLIQLEARDLYNEGKGGRGGSLAFYKKKERGGGHQLIFLGKQTKYKLYDGALYPILGAFRFLVEKKKGQDVYSWKVDTFEEVKEIFRKIAAEMIYITKNTSDNKGKNPNAIGKDDNHWDGLYKTLALNFLTSQLK